MLSRRGSVRGGWRLWRVVAVRGGRLSAREGGFDGQLSVLVVWLYSELLGRVVGFFDALLLLGSG
jgi:hypothetical protein